MGGSGNGGERAFHPDENRQEVCGRQRKAKAVRAHLPARSRAGAKLLGRPMSRPQTDLDITLSVLDRLIDQDPKSSVEAAPPRAQSVRQLKTSLRRDLEWLLNSRRISPEPESLRELNRSVYCYGLPDFSAYNISSAKDQNKLIRVLQIAVKLFEPRLANVRIVP